MTVGPREIVTLSTRRRRHQQHIGYRPFRSYLLEDDGEQISLALPVHTLLVGIVATEQVYKESLRGVVEFDQRAASLFC